MVVALLVLLVWQHNDVMIEHLGASRALFGMQLDERVIFGAHAW